jgi:hypothetical protein
MVTLAAPGADIVSNSYLPALTENGTVPTENEVSNEKAKVETVEVMSAGDSADPVAVAANGIDTKQHEQDGLDNPIDTEAPTAVSENEKKALEVLKIIESYGVDFEKSGVSWKGFESFVPVVLKQIAREESIRMILPAFPFKSPNARDKVLGTMPDFGEELALAHLNGLCQNIAEVYTPGAEVHISSDGLVYNGK